MAWQQHFVTNMFIRPQSAAQIADFDPDFTIINASSQVNERWQEHGLNSEVTRRRPNLLRTPHLLCTPSLHASLHTSLPLQVAVAINVEKKVAVIFGTWYVCRTS